MSNNRKENIGVVAIIILIFVFIIMAAPEKESESINVPNPTLMDDEWAVEFTTVQPGQLMKQFVISEDAIWDHLGQWNASGFNAAYVWIKYDHNTNDIILSLRNPDGTFVELFPSCPPYCPDSSIVNAS